MNIFDEYLKKGYGYEIEKADIDKANKAMTVYVRTNFVVPYGDLNAIGNRIMKAIPEISSVSFAFSYTNMAQPRHDVMLGFLPYLFGQFEKESAGLLNSVVKDDVLLTDNEIGIRVLGQAHADKLNE